VRTGFALLRVENDTMTIEVVSAFRICPGAGTVLIVAGIEVALLALR